MTGVREPRIGQGVDNGRPRTGGPESAGPIRSASRLRSRQGVSADWMLRSQLLQVGVREGATRGGTDLPASPLADRGQLCGREVFRLNRQPRQLAPLWIPSGLASRSSFRTCGVPSSPGVTGLSAPRFMAGRGPRFHPTKSLKGSEFSARILKESLHHEPVYATILLIGLAPARLRFRRAFCLQPAVPLWRGTRAWGGIWGQIRTGPLLPFCRCGRAGRHARWLSGNFRRLEGPPAPDLSLPV